jgi:allophanate hydrolase subunit 1
MEIVFAWKSLVLGFDVSASLQEALEHIHVLVVHRYEQRSEPLRQGQSVVEIPAG